MLVRFRKLILIFIDLILVNLALYLSLWLRFDGVIPPQYWQSFLHLAGYFTVVMLVSFYLFGLYNRIWRYASTDELLAIVYAVTVGVITNIAVTYFLQESLPRSVFAIHWGLTIGLTGGSRLFWRLWRERAAGPILRRGRPALIVGAGDAGAMVAREIKNRKNGEITPVGFVDDDPQKQKQKLLGLSVLGKREDIPLIVERYGIEEIIIAMPSASGQVIRDTVNICQKTPAKVNILPAMYDLLEGKIKVSSIRQIEVEDLLRREPVMVDLKEIAGYLQERRVLVTGAGGSIGSELCRQIALFSPSLLILLDHNENAIFEIEQELAYQKPGLNFKTVIADIRDAAKINSVFNWYKPEIIFHAAAHKHVPFMELNPEEAVRTNILGTKNVAEAACRAGTLTFVLISTDKAVNPTSVMGVSKRVAEIIIQHLNTISSTRFVAVRFGNVLGSSGSVLPAFKKQITRGGPVEVTHPEMTRYFMTIPEAVQLVIQAGAMAEGGEIFILDMGEPVKILELAEELIRLSGFEPYKDIEIKFTGIRPGEKLKEEILTAEEGTTVTKHKLIYKAQPNNIDALLLESVLTKLASTNWADNREELLQILKTLVPSYQPELRIQEQEMKIVSLEEKN